MNTQRVRARRGFTLIEVLVVILIIAGCVLALRPFVKKARERAYSAACANNLRKLSIALYKYARDHDGSFPQAANLKELVVPPEYLVGQILAKDVIDTETGELIAEANNEITEYFFIIYDNRTNYF